MKAKLNLRKVGTAVVIVALCLMLLAGAYKMGIVHAVASASGIFPVDNAITLNTSPDFNITPSSDTYATVNVTLVVDDTPSGDALTVVSGTPIMITCNQTLTPSSTKYPWYFNITDDDGTVSTTTRNIGIGEDFVCPVGDILSSGKYVAQSDSIGYPYQDILSTTTASNLIIDGNGHYFMNGIKIGTIFQNMQNVTMGNYSAGSDTLFYSFNMTNVTTKNVSGTGSIRLNTVGDMIDNSITDCSLSSLLCDGYGTTWNISVRNITASSEIELLGHYELFNSSITNCTNQDMYIGSDLGSIYNINVTDCNPAHIFITTYSGESLHDSIFQNNTKGIYIDPNCQVYNNLFNSTVNIDPSMSSFSGITFNTTLQAGTRIFSSGTDIGGNFWAHPDGTGESETGYDTTGSGFLDIPVEVVAGSGVYDYLPYSLDYGIPTPPIYMLTTQTWQDGTITVNSTGSPTITITSQDEGKVAFTISAASGTGTITVSGFTKEPFSVKYDNAQATYQYSGNRGEVTLSETVPDGTYYLEQTVGGGGLTLPTNINVSEAVLVIGLVAVVGFLLMRSKGKK